MKALLHSIFPFILSGLLFGLGSCNYHTPTPMVTVEEIPVEPISTEMRRFIEDPFMHGRDWDELSQLKFWRQIMVMPKDSAIVNLSQSRKILGKIKTRTWLRLTETQKRRFRYALHQKFDIPEGEDIYVTHGRKHFYQIDKVLSSIDRSIDYFAMEGINPWYAQAILCIESPGQLQQSHVGAYGPFQLMASVARHYGLTVSSMRDDRANFGKSARAAAKLIRDMCIPETRRLLKRHRISYHENELWFRLMVLHCYHAGAGNVGSALRVINPKEGGMQLIQKLWVTTSGGFQNASQNYSQVAMAAMLELDDLINKQHELVCAYGDEVLLGDFYVRRYSVEREELFAHH